MFPQISAAELSKGIDGWRKKKGYACYYLSINRRKSYFADAGDRDDAYNREAALRGLNISDGFAEAVSPRDHLDLAEMRKLMAGRPESIHEVFKVGLDRLPKHTMKLVAARDEFIEEKERAVKAGALKQRSCNQQRHAVDAMVREARFDLTSDIRNPAFKNWIHGRGLSAKGLHSFGKAIGVFLNWLVFKKYLGESPLAEFEIPEPPPKRTIFTVKQVTRVFAIAQSEFPDLVPVLAVMFFAGVRPETAVLLNYESFDRKDKVIRLDVGKFEQGDTKFVERFPDLLWAWLPKGRKGPLAPINCDHRLKAFHARVVDALKLEEWPQDVARHTFASHFVALTGSLEALAFTINHSRPATSLKYYRKRLPERDGIAYFKKILPAKALPRAA